MHLGIDIKGITCDSRRVKPGFAFFAIRGEREDGNDYIKEAINKGASVIYTEANPGSLPTNIPVIRVMGKRIKVRVVSRLIAVFVLVVSRESFVSRKSFNISLPTSRVFFTRLYSEFTIPIR